MSTNDELLATIDAKLSALLKVAVEGQARGATNGPAVPADLAASLEALFAANGSPGGAARGSPAPRDDRLEISPRRWTRSRGCLRSA